jgi:DNA-binding response OmpR family regulator
LRVHNLLGRSQGYGTIDISSRDNGAIEFDGWKVDMGGRSITNPDGSDVMLTNAEFNLFSALVKAPNRVLRRDFLLDAVSRDDDAPSDRLIDVLISRVRKKIESEPKKPKLIVTVPGCGYKFTGSL